MTGLRSPRRSRDEVLAELRRLEIAIALLLGLAAFAALTAAASLVLNLIAPAGWNGMGAFGIAVWSVVVVGGVAVLGWVLRVWRRE